MLKNGWYFYICVECFLRNVVKIKYILKVIVEMKKLSIYFKVCINVFLLGYRGLMFIYWIIIINVNIK